MLELCHERGIENKTSCGTCLELLFFTLLLLLLHLLHTDKHRQDQPCLWEMLAVSVHVGNSSTQEQALGHLFRLRAKQSRGET